jgi:hypothetical protein
MTYVEELETLVKQKGKSVKYKFFPSRSGDWKWTCDILVILEPETSSRDYPIVEGCSGDGITKDEAKEAACKWMLTKYKELILNYH